MPSAPECEAEPPLVLTLDIGTSSARTLLFDRRARHVEGMEARRSYAPRATPDGGAEFDADELARRVEETVDEVLGRAGPIASKIAGVACCTFWHSLMGLGGDGRASTPLYTWADTRSEPFGRALRDRLDERSYHARTGAFFHPLYLPVKLLWLADRHREVFRRAARWVSFGEFLYDRLFGRTRATISMASGTGLLDIPACRYDEEILRAVGVRLEQLSPLGDVGDSLAGLRDPYARRWRALREPPWFPPVGDGACNNLGSGCAVPERIGLMIGTSGAMRVAWATERIEIPWGLWCYRADRRRVVLGGALSEGGNLVDWARGALGLGAPDSVECELAAMDPDAHGLTFLPFLAGERSPGWAAHARGSVLGLTLSTRPIDILRAGMEAVALRFALIYEMLGAAVPQAREIVASGGALLNSPAWIQILADALGRPVVTSAEPEASSRGAALLALEALGVVSRVEDVSAALGRTFQPDPARHEKYRKALERQRRYYELLVQR